MFFQQLAVRMCSKENYQNGFDIYKEDRWQQLRHLRRQRRPHRLWFSVPCTKWCRWTSINYNTPEKREALETMRRKERRMLRQAVSFILESLDEDENINIYWEWTFPCSGWDQHPMISLERGLRERGQEWESCRIDGCCYGMKDEKESGFLLKKWMIRTNDPIFAKNFRFKCCPRNHQHVYIQGIETARSAYYPKKMVESINRHWKRQMAPQRHLQLLADVPHHHVSDEDENWERRRHHLNDSLTCDGCSVLPGSVEDATWSHSQPDQRAAGNDAMAGEAAESEPEAVATDGDGPSDAERDAWTSRLNHYHRAAGHPSNGNLVHLLRDAGLPQWKIAMAKNFRCAACESLKGGSTSSGNIPPAATHPAYRAWQAAGVDSSEWLPPERKREPRFILFMDLATKLKVVHIASE